MPTKMPSAVRQQLKLDVAAIDRDFVSPRPSVVYPKDLPRSAAVIAAADVGAREPFARWLLAQHDRDDWIDSLACAARADRGFPKDGDVAAVHSRLLLNGADPDMFEQLDDAERCWRSQ